MTTTIGSLLDIMARHLMETDRTLSTGLWTPAEAIYALATADQDFIHATGILKKAGGIAGTVAQGTYNEPADSTDVERVSYNGRKLYPQTRFELDRQHPSWRVDTARNARRYHRDSLPEKQFTVWPKPVSAGTGWTVTGRYGTIRVIFGRAYSITGRYGTLRAINGDTNYTIGALPDPKVPPWAGTLRSVLNSSMNFLVFYDVAAPIQTLATDNLFTPDAFARYVMYGALGRLWEKEGDGQDLNRARYCHERYQRGVGLALRLVDGEEVKQ